MRLSGGREGEDLMSDKLHIPAPDTQSDAQSFTQAISMTLLICAVGMYVGFQLLRNAERDAAREVAQRVDEARVMARDVKAQQVSRRLERLDPAALDALELTDAQLRAALLFGPHIAAREVCARLGAQLDGSAPTRWSLARRHHVAQLAADAARDRVVHLSWGCLLRLHLDGQTRAEPVLDAALADAWDAFEAEEMSSAVIEAATEEWRTTRQRPASADFSRWLGRCAMGVRGEAAAACRKLTAQIAPIEGQDLMDLTDLFISRNQPLRWEDWLRITTMLGQLARYGQPSSWRIESTDAQPWRGAGVRVAAILTLCRMAHVDEQDRAVLAAQALSEAGTIASSNTRPVKLIRRWRETCRLAFGAERPKYPPVKPFKEAEPPILDARPVPIVSQLRAPDARGDAPPRLEMAFLIQHKLCAPFGDGAPAWTCALKAWSPKDEEISAALRARFVDTRYIEWEGDELLGRRASLKTAP